MLFVIMSVDLCSLTGLLHNPPSDVWKGPTQGFPAVVIPGDDPEPMRRCVCLLACLRNSPSDFGREKKCAFSFLNDPNSCFQSGAEANHVSEAKRG